MKKIITVIAILITAPVLYAQHAITISGKAGISIPNLTSGSNSTPISTGYGSRLGPDAAIAAGLELSTHFELQVQLGYSSQGGKKNGVQAFSVPADMKPMFPDGAPTYLYARYKSVARINYLLLPVMAGYHFAPEKKWDVYISAGPFVSFLLSAKNITSGSSRVYLDNALQQPVAAMAQSFDHTENIRNDLHQFNTGIAGHIGVSHRINRGKIFIEAGGNYGLIDIQKDGANGRNRTGSAAIDVGYRWRLAGCCHVPPPTR